MKPMLKVLIIDSNDPFRQTLKSLLVSRFPAMVVEEAINAEEAFQKISDFIPDLILTDIRLSGISGLDLTRKIKDSYPKSIVVILTSFDSGEYRDAAFKHGSNYFISKDTSSAQKILALIESIMGKHF
jgi:DNA-binding NarL/FixJ family response regulator